MTPARGIVTATEPRFGELRGTPQIAAGTSNPPFRPRGE